MLASPPRETNEEPLGPIPLEVAPRSDPEKTKDDAPDETKHSRIVAERSEGDSRSAIAQHTWQRVEVEGGSGSLFGGDSRDPVVVSGPTGCGKAMGARSLFTAMNVRIVEFDGADANDARQLVEWIRRAREHACDGDAVGLIVDDFESFTPQLRKDVVKILLKIPSRTPTVVTCSQIRDPAMYDLSKSFRTLVTLYAPNERACRAWLSHKHRSVPQDRFKLLMTGDLRRLERAVVAYKDGNLVTGSVPEIREETCFDSARNFLTRRTTFEEWSLCPDAFEVSLLENNAPRFVAEGGLEVCDVLSKNWHS